MKQIIDLPLDCFCEAPIRHRRSLAFGNVSATDSASCSSSMTLACWDASSSSEFTTLLKAYIDVDATFRVSTPPVTLLFWI
jgi:hypothetical protein